jgi:cell wall assembly regulator SMI1
MEQNEVSTRIKGLIARISEKLQELDRVTEEDSDNVLLPPVGPERIAAFEQEIGLKLPQDYRAFLLLHNGWKNFNGESALLSIEQMTSGRLHDRLAAFQEELAGAGLKGAAEGLIIEGSFGTRITYLDRDKAKGSGNLDVVYWDRREMARYPSFTAFLEDYVEILGKLIEREKENLR